MISERKTLYFTGSIRNMVYLIQRATELIAW